MRQRTLIANSSDGRPGDSISTSHGLRPDKSQTIASPFIKFLLFIENLSSFFRDRRLEIGPLKLRPIVGCVREGPKRIQKLLCSLNWIRRTCWERSRRAFPSAEKMTHTFEFSIFNKQLTSGAVPWKIRAICSWLYLRHIFPGAPTTSCKLESTFKFAKSWTVSVNASTMLMHVEIGINIEPSCVRPTHRTHTTTIHSQLLFIYSQFESLFVGASKPPEIFCRAHPFAEDVYCFSQRAISILFADHSP